MATNTGLTPLERAGDLWASSIWQMMRSGARDPEVVANVLQHIKDPNHPLPEGFATKPAPQKPADVMPIFTLEDWGRHYRDLYGLNVEKEFATMRWPKERLGFGWLVPVPKGIVASAVLAVLEQKQGVKIYNGYGDVDAGHHDRAAAKRGYAVRFRNRVEADEEWTGKSANDLKRLKVVGTTLTERLLLESIFFRTTGQHLDVANWTLCSGSHHSDGYVPFVNWHHGRLYVDWYDPTFASGYLRSREAVS